MNNFIELPNFSIGDDLPLGHFDLHSRFERVVNFVDSSNRIIFLSTLPEVISANGFFVKDIDLSSVHSIDIKEESIFFDKHEILKVQLTVYDSSFDYQNANAVSFEYNLFQCIAKNAHLFPEKSMAFLLFPEREKYFSSGFDFHFMKNAKTGVEKIIGKEMLDGIRMIKGTGTGLTPAGDDFIAGLLLGLHYLEIIHKTDLSELRSKIYEETHSGNLLVNSFLKNAWHGKHFFALKKLLYLLVQNYACDQALSRVLSYGATSGGDLLSGYVFAIKHRVGL